MVDPGNTLAERFNAGEEQAFADIYKRYYRQLLFFIRKFSLADEVAEDLTSEAFVKLYRVRQEGKQFESLDHIKNFLFRITQNAAITHISYSQRQSVYMKEYLTTTEGQLDDDTTRNHRVEVEMLQIIYDAIESLPAECKRIFKMLYVQGRNYKDVALELGLSVQTVRNQKTRAIQLIRSRILKLPTLVAGGLSVALLSLICLVA